MELELNQISSWDKGLSEDDFFIFVEKFGDGFDEDHFQIGFSIKNLIKSLALGKVFHLEAKIDKS